MMTEAQHLETWRQIQTSELLRDAFRRYLTPWELRFVVDLHLWETGLSVKQADCLANVIHNVMAKIESEKAEAAAEKAEAERIKALGENVITFPGKTKPKPTGTGTKKRKRKARA